MRSDRPVVRLLLVVLLALSVVAPAAAAPNTPVMDPPWWTQPGAPEQDFILPPDVPVDLDGATPRAGSADPLGLLANPAEYRWYTSRTDTIQVWSCNYAKTASQITNDLTQNLVPYFKWLSNGGYDLRFIAGGNACGPGEVPNSLAKGTGAMFVLPSGGGFAGPGFGCTSWWIDCSVATWKDTGRYGVAGDTRMIIAHELGHMIHWPHVYSGKADDYDEPMDLMSGNFGPLGGGYGTYPEPYATSAINRYAAGWISPSQVVVHGSGTQSVDLRTPGSGTQMTIVRDTSGYFVLTPRVRSSNDPIPSAWQGVTVHKVLSANDGNQLGNRRTSQWPQTSYNWGAINSSTFTQRLDYIIPVGGSRTVGGVTVRVTQAVTGGYRVSLQGTAAGGGPAAGCEATGTFTDVCDDNVFKADIEWLADSGITRGCNPPANDRFCPTATVTRGQMAAFMVRALGLTANDGTTFTDVPTDNVFRTDIQKLATAGITRGCNPPTNDRFCPDQAVTRAQMAAFMVRAFTLVDNDGTTFTDVPTNNVFRTDIQKLATAGITRGCNPPTNDRYCPTDPVTRQQMAAFFRRAPLP